MHELDVHAPSAGTFDETREFLWPGPGELDLHGDGRKVDGRSCLIWFHAQRPIVRRVRVDRGTPGVLGHVVILQGSSDTNAWSAPVVDGGVLPRVRGMGHDPRMGNPRVFEIANEAGVDVRTALEALRELGSETKDPVARLADGEADLLRAALVPARQRPAVPAAGLPPAPRDRQRQDTAPRAARARLAPAPRGGRSTHSPLKAAFREQRSSDAAGLVPAIFSALQQTRSTLPADGVVVAFFDASAQPRYDLATIEGHPWAPAPESGVTRASLLAPMRALHHHYVERGWTPPNLFIAVDVVKQEAWVGRSAKQVRKNDKRQHHLHPQTLMRLGPATAGKPPRLWTRAESFAPGNVPYLAQQLGGPGDRPEEAFLLHEELLTLAVDSLDSDEQLDPLPVHLNALWVFAKPVVMQRPDGSDRYVRAVWFRQGRAAWRIRTYAAGKGKEPKEVGERIGGPLPFVPVWQEDRPEQKLIAAIWALMAQGDVTETEGQHSIPVWGAAGRERPDLSVVRVKAGTAHAQVYRRDHELPSADRPAWSVRGHWRRQPYPSLGFDPAGHVVTKLIWIASYSKGDASVGSPTDKVISVRL